MAQLPRHCGGDVFFPLLRGGDYFFFLSMILSSGYFLFQAFTIKSLLTLQFSSELKNISSLAHQEANAFE